MLPNIYLISNSPSKTSSNLFFSAAISQEITKSNSKRNRTRTKTYQFNGKDIKITKIGENFVYMRGTFSVYKTVGGKEGGKTYSTAPHHLGYIFKKDTIKIAEKPFEYENTHLFKKKKDPLFSLQEVEYYNNNLDAVITKELIARFDYITIAKTKDKFFTFSVDENGELKPYHKTVTEVNTKRFTKSKSDVVLDDQVYESSLGKTGNILFILYNKELEQIRELFPHNQELKFTIHVDFSNISDQINEIKSKNDKEAYNRSIYFLYKETLRMPIQLLSQSNNPKPRTVGVLEYRNGKYLITSTDTSLKKFLFSKGIKSKTAMYKVDRIPFVKMLDNHPVMSEQWKRFWEFDKVAIYVD